jgi:predicted DNA-binding WGR domain protein
MRTFTLGTGMDRKFVMIGVSGCWLSVTQGKADGTTKRNKKELASADQARQAGERMIQELISRGYLERGPSNASTKSRSAQPTATATRPSGAKPTTRVLEPEVLDGSHVFEDIEAPSGVSEAVIPRLTSAPGVGAAADGAPKKKKKKSGKKKGKKAADGDGLDKRVIAAVAAVGMAVVAFVGYMAYDAFIKPPTIIGTWAGSRLEYETGGPMSFTQYHLVLDDQKRASMSLQEAPPSIGTYTVNGDRLKLTFRDPDGETNEVEYKVSLGRATLDLFEPGSGKKMVELVRFRDKPKVGGGTAPPAAPKDLAGGAVDKAADASLASVAFSPKDGAFKLRHPSGWEVETGSRPDNTYSWARFTKGSAKIQVFADVAGSLMSGSDSARGNIEEGSEAAPVHGAHTRYKKTASEEFSDYKESEPTLFKGSALGEGRVSTFTASGGGLFGSKLRGYRVTLLTNDRRVTLLCSCPDGEFEKLKPTLLAVCRSVAR